MMSLTKLVEENRIEQLIEFLTESNCTNAALLFEPCENSELGGCSLLHVAVMNQHVEMVQLFTRWLLERDTLFAPMILAMMRMKCSVTHQTPLHIAASRKEGSDRESIIELLLRYIVTIDDFPMRSEIINAVDCNQLTPLLTAVSNNVNVSLIRQFIACGADINSVDNYGRSALHLSIIQNNYEVFRRILTTIEEQENVPYALKRVTIYDQDQNGFNALHYAANVGSSKIAERLLTNTMVSDQSALLCAESTDGQIPYFIAVIEKHMDVAALLSEITPIEVLRKANEQIDIIQKESDLEDAVRLKQEEMDEQETPLLEDQSPPDQASRLSMSLPQTIGTYFDSFKESLSNTFQSAKRLSMGSGSLEDTPVSRIGSLPKESKRPIIERSPLDREHDSIVDYIKSLGYPAEKHKVMTDDGFVITMYRIPQGKSLNLLGRGGVKTPNSKVRRPVVFLQHGVCNSSSTWVVTGEKQALAFSLAMSGYDVWMGNNRGTQFGRIHLLYNESQPEYWKFSWDDMAKHDFPSQINYVLEHTGQKSLVYIGHSQGSTQAFAALSTNPELQSKIDLFIALAPVATLKHQTSQIFKLLSNLTSERMINILGISEIGKHQIVRSLLPKFAESLVGSTGFNMMWTFLMDCDIDHSVLPILTQYEPSPTSVWNLAHWAQLVLSGEFHAFDHGATENTNLYGQNTPRMYDITTVTTPVAVFYGGLDYLANPTDIESFLLQKLPNVIYTKKIDHFKHNDFVWGKDACREVYQHIITLLLDRKEQQTRVDSPLFFPEEFDDDDRDTMFNDTEQQMQFEL